MPPIEPGYSVILEVRAHEQALDGEWKSIPIQARTMAWFKSLDSAIHHSIVLENANGMLATGDLELPEPHDGDPDG